MAVTSWIRRQFKNGVITTATSTMTSGATTFTVNTGAGSTFPDGSVGPFIVTVDQGQAAEEKILVTSRSTDTFTVAASGRGYNGTTAQAHTNATVYHTIDQQDLDEANQVAHQTLGAITTSGDLLQGSAANTLTRLALGTTGQLLVAGASSAAWGTTVSTSLLMTGDDAAWNNVSGGIGFTNSWVNSAGTGFAAGYRKFLGRVYVRGAITGGNSATSAFTLPAGYRPSSTAWFAIPDLTSTAFAEVQITTAGLVIISFSGSPPHGVALDQISFDTL